MKIIARYFLFLFPGLFFSIPGKAGMDRTDSLLDALKNTQADTSRANIFKMLSYEFRSKDTAQSRDYARQCFKLSQKINFPKGMGWAYSRFGSLEKNALHEDAAIENYQMALMYYGKANYKKGLMQAYLDIAGVYRKAGKYDEAFTNYTKLKELAENSGDKPMMVEALGGYANIYRYRDDYVTSLDYYQRAINLADSLGDKRAAVSLMTNMAIIYSYRKNYKEEWALRWKCYRTYRELADSTNMILALNNLGNMHYDQGNRDSAKYYYLRSLDIVKRIGDERAGYKYVSDCYQSIGMIAIDEGNLKLALEDYKRSLDYMIRGREKKGTGMAYGDLVDLYIRMGNWKEAEQCAQRELDICSEIGYKRGMMNAYGSLSDISKHNKDFPKAFEYLSNYTALRDSILNEKSNNQLAEMQTKFETAKKEQELKERASVIANQDKEVKQQTMLVYIFVGVSVLFLALGFVLLRQYGQKRKANALLEKHNLEIRIQAKEISEQKEIIEAKNKDITDSIHYARHIQEAIIPPDDLVYEYLKECFILYKPKDIVSGDFYWVHKQADNVMFSVIDCTGHGVPGALMSVLAHSAIKSVITQRPTLPPSGILNFVHDAVKETFKHQYKDVSVNDGMDIAMCSLDRNTMKLRYAGARIPLCVVRGTELIEVKGDKQTIAGSSQETCEPFTFHELDVQKGDNIYIFSDGYADQFGGQKGKKFKYNNLKQLLLSIAVRPMYLQKQLLDKTIEDWRGN
ncbi:MAG TPA: tetratricopeptide repeat protein, partial [Bacteroidia bacterium]